ncbi:MAG TPA: prepilin-type N-terminal cleavage/methylation domain-containing protein [bacterium]|nr:prepilin-type N-terminal cleavage/methylation domain-containing protein [bacterium]
MPRPHGFTIVEMIVVFSVLAVLAVIAAKTYTTVYAKAKLARVETALNEIDAALQRFKAANGGYYPGLAPWPVDPQGTGQYRRDFFYAGPRIIGGSAGPVDDATRVDQDDYLFDKKGPDSPFTAPAFSSMYPQYRSNITRANSPMKPVDALVRDGFMPQNRYPQNPFKPGSSMVNVAFTLGSYDRNTNTFRYENLPAIGSFQPTGVTLGRPTTRLDGSLPPAYRYSLIAQTWSNNAAARNAMAEIYPEGDFAYIPLGFKDPTGALATDYWLIGYGNLDTLDNSAYNVWLEENPTGPDFPPPMGDNNPRALTPFERAVRRLMVGALTIKGSKYTEQLDVTR